ncbi:MAG: hypothetical protein GY809_29995, partial [Planctomycetes bacterium]|nr:hypothetical protein [Planctomycetota bacterium]
MVMHSMMWRGPTERQQGVPIPFRRHKDKLIEQVVITHPDFVWWLLGQQELDQFAYVDEHIRWCIKVFVSVHGLFRP